MFMYVCINFVSHVHVCMYKLCFPCSCMYVYTWTWETKFIIIYNVVEDNTCVIVLQVLHCHPRIDFRYYYFHWKKVFTCVSLALDFLAGLFSLACVLSVAALVPLSGRCFYFCFHTYSSLKKLWEKVRCFFRVKADGTVHIRLYSVCYGNEGA
jgi:hypothetical protein